MDELIADVRRWRRAGLDVALATVIRTAGSSPRPLGSKMAVSSAGDLSGSVSGGCIEGAVFTEAELVLADGVPRRRAYGVSDEEAWAVGLSCGGEIEVFIERLTGSDAAAEVLEQSLRCIEEERRAAVITVLEPEDGAVGAKRLLTAGGESLGTLGPALDAVVDGWSENGELFARTGMRRVESSVAGAEAELFVEILEPAPHLVIVGAVHVAIHLVHLAQRVGFRCTVVDARETFATAERFGHADVLTVGWPAEALEAMELDGSADTTFCVFLTHDPKLDDPALVVALNAGVRYVGALGSKRTHAKRVASLRERGVSEEQIARIAAPIGLPLGGRRPEEIALSIAAQLVEARYRR